MLPRDQLNNIATNPPGSLCIEALHNSAKLDQGADRLTFAALKLTKALQAAYAASSLSPDGAPARVAALTALPELCCSAGLPRLALGDAALAAKCFESAREAEQRGVFACVCVYVLYMCAVHVCCTCDTLLHM